MKSITVFFISAAILLIAAALFSISKQKDFMLNYSEDLNTTVSEAISVRIELEEIMKEAIGISQTIVNNFEDNLISSNNDSTAREILASPAEETTIEEKPTIICETQISVETEQSCLEQSVNREKTRIYELARELDMSSKELLKVVKSNGINVNNHMNMLDEEQVLLIRRAIYNEKTIGDIDQVNNILDSDSELIDAEQLLKASVLDILIGKDDTEVEHYLNSGMTDNDCPALLINTDESSVNFVKDPRLPQLGFSLEDIKSAHPYIAVRTLYEKGYSVREIAKLLDRGQGEVGLILNIAKKKSAVI